MGENKPQKGSSGPRSRTLSDDVPRTGGDRGGTSVRRGGAPTTGKPNRESRGAGRDRSARVKATAEEGRSRPETETVPGHGPNDLDAGTATKEHLETHGLEPEIDESDGDDAEQGAEEDDGERR